MAGEAVLSYWGHTHNIIRTSYMTVLHKLFIVIKFFFSIL